MTRRWLWLALMMGCGGEETYVPEEPEPFGGGIEVPDTQLSDDDLPCSSSSGAAATLAIQNPLAETVEIYWRDSACEERLYNTLGPGEGYSQGTFTTHVWVARRVSMGGRFDYHVVTGPTETWSVTP